MFIVACLSTVVLLPFYIALLKRYQIKQYLRVEGPASHAAKAKTPTMGGVCFIAGTLICLIVAQLAHLSIANSVQSTAVVLLACSCGLIGFLDDFSKVREHSNKGISARLRLVLEIVLGALFALAMIVWAYKPALGMLVPAQLVAGLKSLGVYSLGPQMDFAPTGVLNLAQVKLAYALLVPLSMFLVAATTNAVNLHDGMDGLAAGTSVMVFLCLAAMLFASQQYALTNISLAAAGAISGFFLFNKHPAKIFMGDTGSLFIGGLMAGLVLAGGLVLWFVPLSAIYIAEAISVMLQVVYFKITKPYVPAQPTHALVILWTKLTKRLPEQGKRLFRMAPLHHHFEAVLLSRGLTPNQAEWQVVGGFWLTQVLLCAITMATFFVF